VTVYSRHPRVHASYFASKKDPGSLSFWYPLGTKPRWSCRCSWCAATFASTRRQRSRRQCPPGLEPVVTLAGDF